MAAKVQKYERFRALRKARVQNRTWNFLILTAFVSGVLLLARGVFDNVEPSSFIGRHLLSSGGCPYKDDEESLDYPHYMLSGGVALYFIGVIYLFLGIAIVCDDFFVASLEAISDKLNLSEDVAGATFMAAGSSAPELFSSVVSLANPNATSEVGVGTIVGSAVFNVLVIIGVTAVFAGQTLNLDWKPVCRDTLFYSGAIISIIVFFRDGMIKWYEGMVSVFLYASYVLFMVFNAKIMDWLDRLISSKVEPAGDEETAKFAEEGKEEDTIPANSGDGGEEEGDEDGDDETNPFKPPKRFRDVPLWLLSFPWYCAFTITIPDCSKAFWDKWYLVSFGMSIAWIGLISWYMVEWCVAIGCILKIPLSVMGVTVLAAGTSIPDALSSIVVAKQGQGNMAVANAIGSNVFDIWLGLGLPWWVILLIDYVQSDQAGLCVSTKELLPNIIVLFSVLAFYFGLLVVCRFRLYVGIGYAFICMYAVFAVWQVVGVWRFDVYNLSVPGVTECLCHIDVSHGVTALCYDAANGKHVAQDHDEYGVNQYEQWWEDNKGNYLDRPDYNPTNWTVINSDH